MQASQLFEIFNHTMTTRDPAQILDLATDLQVYSSELVGNGRIFYGNEAPQAFRKNMRKFITKAGDIRFEVKQSAGDGNGVVIVTDIKRGLRVGNCIMQFGIEGGKWVSFIEKNSL